VFQELALSSKRILTFSDFGLSSHPLASSLLDKVTKPTLEFFRSSGVFAQFPRALRPAYCLSQRSRHGLKQIFGRAEFCCIEKSQLPEAAQLDLAWFLKQQSGTTFRATI
jgi:hypothetical protein